MRSFIEVDLNKIKDNIEEIKKINKKEIIAVIKTNAYGLGIVEIAKYLETLNIKRFFVATIEEGILLRKNNIRSDIIVLEHSKDYYLYLQFNLIYTLYNLNDLETIIKMKLPIRMHIKYDSGLNRLGIIDEEIEKITNLIKNNKLLVEGIFTHISSEDTYQNQCNKFEIFAKKLNFLDNILIHLDSTRFINKNNFSNAIRIGMGLFNYKENALKLFSPIIRIKEVNKDELVGYNTQEKSPSKGFLLTIPLGYGDGWNTYRRTLGYIDEHKIQQIGETCMDYMMLFSKEKIKSPTIEIIGENLSPSYLSKIYGESIYSLYSSLSYRLKRKYKK